jgi:hypothetical protein
MVHMMSVSCREAYRGMLPSCAAHALSRVGESLVEDAMRSSETRKSVGVDVTSTARISIAGGPNKMHCTFIYKCMHLAYCLINAYSI